MELALVRNLQRFAAGAWRLKVSFARPEVGVLLLLAGCTSLPSLEDAPTNALSAPPAANFEVARNELPPVNPQQPPLAGQTVAEPQQLAPAVPDTPAQAPEPEPQPPTQTALAEPPKTQPAPVAPAPPNSLEEEDEAAIAVAEPPPKEVPDGQADATYSPYGIEVTLGDGNMCVGDLPTRPQRLKTGMVFQVACSDDRIGSVKIDKLTSEANAQGSLKLGAAKAQRLDVVVEN